MMLYHIDDAFNVLANNFSLQSDVCASIPLQRANKIHLIKTSYRGNSGIPVVQDAERKKAVYEKQMHPRCEC